MNVSKKIINEKVKKIFVIRLNFHILGHICDKTLLERFPDSSFNASASSEGHSASDARISSGSSWCAPVSAGKHYLQVDFGRLYIFDNVAIFGDGTSSKWVATYKLDYTVDLINWRSVGNQTVIPSTLFFRLLTIIILYSFLVFKINRSLLCFCLGLCKK